MKINIETGVSGLYKKIEVLNASGVKLREFAGFANLITNIGLSRLGGTSSIFNHCRVGTGTANPQPTDSSLQNQIGTTSSTTTVMSNNLADGYAEIEITYTFPLGGVVGNISELATGWDAAAPNSIFSRTRILDGNGNPTTITILADEILRVTWAHRKYWPTIDNTGTLLNSGNKGGSYDWTLRAAQVGSWTAASSASGGGLALHAGTGSTGYAWATTYSGDIGSIETIPAGGRGGGFSRSLLGATTLKLSFSTAQGNTPFRSITFGCNGPCSLAYQIQFTPDLVKTANDLMELELSHSWVRR